MLNNNLVSSFYYSIAIVKPSGEVFNRYCLCFNVTLLIATKKLPLYETKCDGCPVCRYHITNQCIMCQANQTQEECADALGTCCSQAFHFHCISRWSQDRGQVCPWTTAISGSWDTDCALKLLLVVTSSDLFLVQ